MKLDEYKNCFDLSFDKFIAQHNVHRAQIDENVRYEKITNARRVELSENECFFFEDGTLKLIYVSNEVLAKKIWDEFKNSANAGIPEKTVRSRAGKTSNQVIFAGQGITASITRNDLDFIELYPPCSPLKYLDTIYQEPPSFIR